MPKSQIKTRQIVGISMSPELAVEIKAEAAERGITLRNLFEEMWDTHNRIKKKNKS